MPENHLAHDLNRGPRSRSVGSCVSPQIMGPQPDSHNLACLLHNDSRRRIGNREDLCARLDGLLPNVFLQAIGQFLWDEGDLCLPTALGCLNDDSSPLNIRRGQFQHFPDSHSSSGHHLQDKTVSFVLSPEDDLVHGFLFNDLPGNGPLVFERFAKEGRFAGVHELLIAGVDNEAEKGAEKRKAESFGGLLGPFGVVNQEGQDIFRGNRFPLPVTELGGKSCQKVFVVSERVFFSSSSCGSPENTSRPGTLSWQSSLFQRVIRG